MRMLAYSRMINDETNNKINESESGLIFLPLSQVVRTFSGHAELKARLVKQRALEAKAKDSLPFVTTK
jgi:hypothetical protein